MLTHLHLRDLVIVDEAELEFAAGLTALTGETGAGKSIIVDALLLIAGGRAGGDVVRQGAERAEVAASFDTLPGAVEAWLNAQAIAFDGEILIRRVIGADGRSRGYVNGQMVPMQALRELAEHLIDIHGQQEFQRLVNRAAQREMLDEGLPDAALLDTVAAIYARHREARTEFESLRSAAADRESRLDLLRFQCAELKAEVGTAAAIEELFLDAKRIAGRGKLAGAAKAALDAAYEADGANAHDLLGRAQSALRGAGEGDPELAGAARLLAESMIGIQEAAEALRRYLDALDIDPARQEEIERHAAALEGLARKHRIGVLELPEQLLRTERDLEALENSHQSLAALEARIGELSRDYRAAAQRLTAARRIAAKQLGAAVSTLMQSLGMAGGRFEAAVSAGESEFGAHGSDDIEFLVSANPGQAPKSLARVASGGELSRISLAIQVAAAAKATALCMVFDEVDAGIGGAVAEIVGRQLRALGSRAQVLCVTHLAQVASQAHGQFRISKLSDGKKTRTTVKRLNAEERVDEIARMLGGIDVTESARGHAREMLSLAGTAEAAPKKKRIPASRR